MSILCDVITKTGNTRSEIIPYQDFDHPFVMDYYNKISKSKAEDWISEMIKRVE